MASSHITSGPHASANQGAKALLPTGCELRATPEFAGASKLLCIFGLFMPTHAPGGGFAVEQRADCIGPGTMIAREPRKNLMLAATITADEVSAPVRIRNLSERGAMIDGAALPEPGSTLMLTRLELSVQATAVWTRDGRCGLQLASSIVVDDWIAGVRRTRTTGNLGQLRVDQIQAAVRSGAALPTDAAPSAAPVADAAAIDRRIAQELAALKRALDEVGETLADDVDILMRHEGTLQKFDIAVQTMQYLADLMAAPDRAKAVGDVPMHDLRSRLSGSATLT